jgi:hypothetical protein
MKRSSYYGLDLNKLSAFETSIDSNASGACEIINGHDEFTVIRSHGNEELVTEQLIEF